MKIVAENPLKYAKKILYHVIPEMHSHVFASKISSSGDCKSNRRPVPDEIVCKFKSKKNLV